MNPDVQQTTADLFRRAIELECKAFDIYTHLSDMFAHVPHVAHFWQQLARDESQHADALSRISQSLTPQQLASPADRQLSEMMTRAESIGEQDLLGPIENLDDAYELAHRLECSEVNVIFRHLATQSVASEQRKRLITLEITKHQERLLDFGERTGPRTRRRKIEAQRAPSPA